MFFSVWIFEINLIVLPGFLCALSVMPSFVSMSLPIMFCVLFSTISTLHVLAVQDLDIRLIESPPFNSILLFVKLL